MTFRKGGHAPRRTTTAGLLLVLLVLAGVPAAPATADPAPPLRVGDVAAYDLTLQNPSIAMSAVVEVGAAESCEDGFDRVFACHAVQIKHTVPSRRIFNMTLSYHLSTQHAEFVGWGTWALDGRTHQQVFASDSPLWQGSPYPAFRGTTSDLSRGMKLLLNGVLVPSARASASDGGPTSVATHPGVMTVTEDATTRVVQLAFPHGRNATAEPPVVYTATYALDEPLPTNVTVEQGGVLIGSATRTSYAAGGAAVSFAGYAPLDLPTHPQGVPRMGFDAAPPSRNKGFYYPFRDVYLVESATPHALLFAVQHPEQYVSTAFYEERVRVESGVETRSGRWSITHANGSATRSLQAVRMGPEALHAAHADLVIESMFTSPAGRLYTPARADLPRHAIAFEDALDVAKGNVPLSEDVFMGSWYVPEFPGVSHTAHALWYWFQCGPVEGGYTDFVTFVSGVNGQTLSRIGDGSSACVPEEEGFAAADAPLLPDLPRLAAAHDPLLG